MFQKDEIQALYDYSYRFLENNLNQIQRYVVPELQECAYEIMCDFWGKSFVDKVKSLKWQIKNSVMLKCHPEFVLGWHFSLVY